MRTSYRILLFDLDDTLLDQSKLEDEALAQIRRRFFGAGIDPAALRATYREANQAVWREFGAGRLSAEDARVSRWRRVMERHAPASATEVHAESVSELFVEAISREADWIPGVEEAFSTLSAHYETAVVTNGIARVQRLKARAAGIYPGCDQFLCSEELGIHKPDPRIFRTALSAAGLEARQALMVGDSLHTDFQGAIDSGIDFCWIQDGSVLLPPGFPSPTYSLRSVAELPQILLHP